jgi:hypothetical protein
MQMGSCWDELGEPNKAVDIYKDAIKQYPGEHLLHYNLALTYSNQKKPDLAIAQVKEELYLTPGHASSNYLLGTLFQENGYTIPAIFALSRFLILEPKSSKSSDSLKKLQILMNTGVQAKDEKNINITLYTGTKKDEGDYEPMQTALAIVSAGRFLEKNKNKSPMEQEVEQFSSSFACMLELMEDKKNKLKFTGDYYVPYFIEMQKQKHVETFVYLIHSSSEEEGVLTWLEKNPDKIHTFLEWSHQEQNWPIRVVGVSKKGSFFKHSASTIFCGGKTGGSAMNEIIRHNRWRVYFYMTLIMLILGGLGMFLSNSFGWGLTGTGVFLTIGGLVNLFSYYFSDRLIMRASRAKPLHRVLAPELFTIVENWR